MMSTNALCGLSALRIFDVFKCLFAIKIKYIYITMLKHIAASINDGEYFKYFQQGAFLSLDHTNHLLLCDVLGVYVGWCVISTYT